MRSYGALFFCKKMKFKLCRFPGTEGDGYGFAWKK